jgi:hypothetical protein
VSCQSKPSPGVPGSHGLLPLSRRAMLLLLRLRIGFDRGRSISSPLPVTITASLAARYLSPYAL